MGLGCMRGCGLRRLGIGCCFFLRKMKKKRRRKKQSREAVDVVVDVVEGLG